jgi:hypothetical protein
MLSNHLALEATKNFNHSKFLPEVKKLLNDFNISEHEWELIRKTRWKADDGEWYLSPDRLDDDAILSDSDLESLIRLESDKTNALDEIDTFLKDETVMREGRNVQVKERVEELREKIARLKLKRTKEDIKLRERFETEKDEIEKIHGKGGVMSEGLLNTHIQKYMARTAELEDFNRATTRLLKRHYQTEEGGRLAARMFMEGMDVNIKNNFVSEFAEHWKIVKGKGVWLKNDLKAAINRHITGEEPSLPLDPKKYPEADPRQETFKFLDDMDKKETQDAWSEFLSIMAEDEAHLDWFHKRMQKDWKDQSKELFTGFYDQQGKWHAPAIYKEGLFTPKDMRKFHADARKKEEKAEQLRKQLPGWMQDFIQAYKREDVRIEDIQRKRNQLSTKLSTLFYDRNDHAVLIPGAKEKRIMTQGARSGTILGEAVRFIGQFKTFPVTLMTKSLQQEMNGKALGELGSSERMQLAKFIAGMTMMGAITTVATDFLRNKTTRETFDPSHENFLDFTSEIGFQNGVDAFVYGGGAGFYGDVLAQPYGTSKNFSAIKSLLGPTFSQYDDIIDITLGVLNGDAKAKKAYSVLLQNTPGQNLFYAKTALDYLLNYQMQDIIDPGYHYKRAGKMRQETGQEYRFGPEGFFQ